MIRLVILVLALSGCGAKQEHEPWETAPTDYTCTEQQVLLVQKDTEFCIKHTGYFSTYCYGTAFIRNCTKKGQP